MAGLLALGLMSVLTFSNTPDDALITLRYAWNLVHHGQPVFNLGEHVEGYTSPLHLLVASAVLLLPGGDALFKLKLVSLAFAAATVWQTNRLAQGMALPRWARTLALAAVGGSWNFAISASNGLETSLVAFLATGTAAALVKNQEPSRTAVWAGLLALVRPDALLTIAMLALASLLHRDGRGWRRRIAWTGGPALTLSCLLVFRLAYYGALVPNTFFAKHLPVAAAAVSGLRYLLDSQPLGGWGLGIVVIPVELYTVWFGVRRFLRARPALRYPISVVIAQVLAIVGTGGDWMNGGRFLAPAIPALTLLVLTGVEALLSAAPGAAPPRRRTSVAIFAFAFLIAPLSATAAAPAWRLAAGITDTALIERGNYPLSNLWASAPSLLSCLARGESVAYSEVGLLGFEHPELRVIDTSGLTNNQIATTAPAADKHPWGITEVDWFTPRSPIGRVLLATRPNMILAFDVAPGVRRRLTVLDGQYTRAAVDPIPDRHVVVAYVRHDLACKHALAP